MSCPLSNQRSEEPILTKEGLLIMQNSLLKSIIYEMLGKELSIEFRIKWRKEDRKIECIFEGINEFIHQASYNDNDTEIFTKKINIMPLIQLERVI